MKKNVTMLAFGILLLPMQAQTRQAENNAQETKRDHLNEYLTEQNQMKRMWKLNLFDVAIMKPSIALEQKIGKRTTLETELQLNLFSAHPYSRNYFWGYESNHNFNSWQRFRVNVNYKFYYNTNKRSQKEKPAGGFFGGYLVSGLEWGNGYYRIRQNFSEPTLRGQENRYGAKLGWGYHQKIGNVAYLDFDTGIKGGLRHLSNTPSNLSNTAVYITPYVDIKVGLYLNKFNRPFRK